MQKSRQKIHILILLFVFSFTVVKAQFGMGKPEDIQRLKEVPLLVVLESPNESVVKKLSKKDPEGLQDYYSDIESNNNALEAAIPSYWTSSKEIKFISKEEAKQYNDKKNKRNYAFFRPVVYDRGHSKMSTAGLIVTYSYAVFLSGEKKPVYSMMYGSEKSKTTLNESDLKFICQQMQNYFVYRTQLKGGQKSKKELIDEMYKNAEVLGQKTVLLNKDDLNEKLIEEIDNIYKFNYKLTTKEEIDKIILNEDKNFAYLKILPVGQISGESVVKVSKLMHAQFFVNAENGQILTMITPSPVGMGGPLGVAMKNGKGKVSKKDLMKVVDRIEKSK